MVWIMVPAGEPTQETVDKLAKLLEKGDMIIDGGNSKWTDDQARAEGAEEARHRLRRRRHERRRLGPGGRLLHDGRRPASAAVKRLAPILDILAPGERAPRGARPGLGAHRPDAAPATT